MRLGVSRPISASRPLVMLQALANKAAKIQVKKNNYFNVQDLNLRPKT